MKTILELFRKLLLASMLLGIAVSAQADPITLELTPSSQVAETGDEVMLDLVISGLTAGGPDSLGEFDVDILYDVARLVFSDYTLGSSLGDESFGEAVDFSFGDLGGLIDLAVVSLLEADSLSCFICIAPYLDDIQGASFLLATLTFQVLDLEPGNSTTVSISDNYLLGDGFGLSLGDAGLGDAVIRNPGVGVPEPGALALFSLGLLGLFGARRSRRLRRG